MVNATIALSGAIAPFAAVHAAGRGVTAAKRASEAVKVYVGGAVKAERAYELHGSGEAGAFGAGPTDRERPPV